MGDLISKARNGRLAALESRNRTMLFAEAERRSEEARKTVIAFRSRRGVTVYG